MELIITSSFDFRILQMKYCLQYFFDFITCMLKLKAVLSAQ